MGALRCPTPEGERSNNLVETVDRIFAAKAREGVLERKMDELMCALYDTAPEENKIIKANSSKQRVR
jgi:hypothetical protein